MRNIVITAAVIGGLGVFMAQMADKIAPAKAVAAKPAATVAMATSASPGSRTLSIPRDFRG